MLNLTAHLADSKRSLAMTVVAVGVLGAVAAVATGAIPSLPDLNSVSPKTTFVTPDLESAFPSLARSQQAHDTPPPFLSAFGDRGAGAHWGVSVGLARLVVAPSGTHMWLLPGTTGTCIVLAEGQGECGPNGGANGVETTGIWMLLVPTSGADPAIEGVLPTGSTLTVGAGNQSQRTVPLSADNAFTATVPHGSRYVVHGPAGVAFADTLQ